MELPLIATNATKVKQKLNNLLGGLQCDQLAVECGMIKRQRKLSAQDFLQLCVLSENLASCSLEGLTGRLLAEGVDISKQALDSRFNNSSVEFLKSILRELLAKSHLQLKAPAGLHTLNGIYIADSSRIMLPEGMAKEYPGFGGNSSVAGVSMFFEYELLKGSILQMSLHPATSNDYSQGEELIADLKGGELILRDLGFYKVEHFEKIAHSKAFFLSRYKTGTLIFKDDDPHSKPLDLISFIKGIAEGHTREVDIFLGRTHRVACRLVIDKFDAATTGQRRRKLKQHKKAKGEQVSRQRLALCSSCIYITNLPASQFPATSIRSIYALRWQVEIIFKVWKSIFGINKIKKVQPKRLLCAIYAKLISILICSSIFFIIRNYCIHSAGIHLSELKGHRVLHTNIHWLKNILRTQKCSSEMLKLLTKLLLKTAKKEKRKHHLSAIDTRQMLALN